MAGAEEKKNKRQTGAYYEQAAGHYLEQLGYEILEYNYRCRSGEIDIIAKDGAYVVFCEVKYRADARKQNVIFRCAMYYLAEHHLNDVPCRFDVIGIQGQDGSEDAKVTYIKNAFTG